MCKTMNFYFKLVMQLIYFFICRFKLFGHRDKSKSDFGDGRRTCELKNLNDLAVVLVDMSFSTVISDHVCIWVTLCAFKRLVWQLEAGTRRCLFNIAKIPLSSPPPVLLENFMYRLYSVEFQK